MFLYKRRTRITLVRNGYNMSYLAVFLEPITNLWDYLPGTVYIPVPIHTQPQGIEVITILIIVLGMKGLLNLYRKKRNGSININLDPVIVKHNNIYYNCVIDKNDLTGANINILYQHNSADIRGFYIDYHGSTAYAATPHPITRNMDSIIDNFDINFYNDIIADNSTANDYYVTSLHFPAPNRNHWAYLENYYNLKVYHDRDRIYITTDEDDNGDILNLTIRKRNLLNEYTLYS